MISKWTTGCPMLAPFAGVDTPKTADLPEPSAPARTRPASDDAGLAAGPPVLAIDGLLANTAHEVLARIPGPALGTTAVIRIHARQAPNESDDAAMIAIPAMTSTAPQNSLVR